MSRDFEELLASLNAADASYLIGGAHALAFHARPRATKDLHLFIDPTLTNARRIRRALGEFLGGDPPDYVSVDALLDPASIVQLGVAPVRVDLISVFGTLTFRQAWAQRVEGRFGPVPTHYLSRDHLIAEKRYHDRPQDRADVGILLRTQQRPQSTPHRGRRKKAKSAKPRTGH